MTWQKLSRECSSLLAWLGHGGMSGHYDQIKNDVAFRKDVVNRCGVGFDVPASFAPIEPNEPKIEVSVDKKLL